MDNQKINKNEGKSLGSELNFNFKESNHSTNLFPSSVIHKQHSFLYNNLIKENNKNSFINNKPNKLFLKNTRLLPFKSEKQLNPFHKNLVSNGLTLNDAIYLGPSINKKYLRANDINCYLSNSIISQPYKYKIIEKNIQNKLLDISMEIYENNKINSETSNNESTEKKPKKIQKSSKKVTFINDKINISKKSILNYPKSLSIKSYDMSNFQFKEQIIEKSRKIIITKNLYDSMGEDESDENIEEESYGLSPESITIDIFDCLLLISSLFCLFYLPLRLSKTKFNINSDEYLVLFMIFFSEIIYIFDLILGFFRWYYNNELKLVKNNKMILKNYLYGNFFIDLIAAIPFYTILRSIPSNIENNKYEMLFNEKNFIIKILCCLKAIKIFKINNRRNNRAIYFFNKKFSNNYLSERIYQISNFAIITLSVLNIFICFHIYIGKLSYPNWILSSQLEDKLFIEIYISSLYFIMATMTSVGYGDIVCINKEETCFQILLLSIGVVAYSWIISTVGDYVKNESKAKINYHNNKQQLEEIRISYPNMPFKLYNNIHQHLKRLLRQQKKFDSNILINNLPYKLKNNLLFAIHRGIVNKFIFFRGCENSDFILKVLTHFIPLYSKKNSFLIKEGEIIENIFFVKDGRLALEAAIDLDNIEKSVVKYLEYQFNEISSVVETEIEKSLVKLEKSIIECKEKRRTIENHEELLDIIQKLSKDIGNISYMHETHIEEEIGRCDFNEGYENIEKGNNQFLHILDILKNEYFGEVYMFLNKPSPLSLRVKSKKADLFILRKKDAINIKKDYPNIWKRINEKSKHNMKSIKVLTKKIIKGYCIMNGILPEKEVLERSDHLFGYKTDTHLSKEKSANSKNSKNINNTKKRASKKHDKQEDDLTPKRKNKNKNNNKNEILNTTKEINTSQKDNISNSNSESKEEEIDRTKKEISIIEIKSKNLSKKSSLSLKESNKSLNEKLNRISNIKKEEKVENNNKQNENKNNKNDIKDNSLQLFKLHEQPSNHQMTNNAFKTEIIYNNNYNNILNNSHQNINQTNNINNNLTNYNNLVISNTNLLSQIPHFNFKSSNSIINDCNLNLFLSGKLIKETPIKIEYLSNYKNINELSKGKYINNEKFQKALHKFVNYYINITSKRKKNKSNKNNDNSESTFDINSYKQSSKKQIILDINNSSFINSCENNFNKIKKENSKIRKERNSSPNIKIVKEKNNKTKLINDKDLNTKSNYNFDENEKEKNNNNNNGLKENMNKFPKNIKKDKLKISLDNNYLNDDTNKNKICHVWSSNYNFNISSNKIINSNFYLSGNNISSNNNSIKENFKLMNEKININSSNNIINSNSNNEINYNYTKNYCIIF